MQLSLSPKEDKLKVLMIQLPVSVFSPQKPWGNPPLAAGFLSAMVSKSDLAGRVDIEILDIVSTNLSADARMIDIIISRAPDILCFSLYSWNSMRSLYIAREIKKALPKIKIIVGGPEVTEEDTEYVMNNPAVDIGCIGEGEFTFVEIIRTILSKDPDYQNIDGIFYRSGSRVTVTSPRRYNSDTDSIPSPYLSGIIDPAEYGCIWVETKRGCAGRCSYCSERLRPIRIFSPERICRELKMAIDKKVSVYFIESDLISNPDFREIFQYLKKINRNKGRLLIAGEARAESLSEEVVDLLKEAGVNSIEVGLQSINSDTLGNINRPIKPKKFFKGVTLLKKKKIGVRVDIIIGLPEETLEDFKTTVRFLKERDLRPNVYVLKLEPGTQIRKEAERYRIKYQKRPPYRILEAPYISGKEIKEGVREARAVTWAGKKRLPFLESMASYSAYNYRQRRKNSDFEDPDEKEGLKYLVNKIVIDLDSSTRSTIRLRSAGMRAARVVGQPLTLWFKTEEIVKNIGLIKSFLSPVAAANPFLLWNIVLEISKSFPISIIRKIKKSIPSREDPADFPKSPYRICAVFPWRESRIKRRWLATLSKTVPFYWSIEFSKEDNWEREIEGLFREQHNIGLLVDFDPSCGIDFIIKVSRALFKKGAEDKDRSVAFRNYALNQIMPILREKSRDGEGEDRADRVWESMLVFDKDLNISPLSRPGNAASLNSIRWLIELKKALKRDKGLIEAEKRISGWINRLLGLGFRYEEIKEYNKALWLHKEMLKLFADNPAVHLALGMTYFNLKEYRKAVKEAEKAIEL